MIKMHVYGLLTGILHQLMPLLVLSRRSSYRHVNVSSFQLLTLVGFKKLTTKVNHHGYGIEYRLKTERPCTCSAPNKISG